MRLVKRTNGIYVVDTRHPETGKRLRLSTGTRNRAEAEREARRLLTELETGRLNGYTVRDALWHTYRERWAHLKSSRTFYERAKALDEAVIRPAEGGPPYSLGRMLVADVTYSTLLELVATLRAQGNSAATINRKLSALSTALGEAKKLGKLAKIPPFPRQKEDNRIDRYLTEDEERRLLAACLRPPARKLDRPGYWLHRHRLSGTYMYRLIEFLLDTGARLSEALNVQPSHVRHNLKGEPVAVTFVRTKSDAPRSVPLTPRAAKALRKLLVHPLHGKIDKHGAVARFQRIRKLAGVSEDVTLHILRHTCASRLVQAGVPIYTVRDWLGHSSVTVTERYATNNVDSLTAAMKALCRPSITDTGQPPTDS